MILMFLLVFASLGPLGLASTQNLQEKGREEVKDEAVRKQNGNKKFKPKASAGKAHGTTKITSGVDHPDHHLVVKVSNTPVTANVGELVPQDRTVTNPYQSGTDISGVDQKINKYVAVYEVNEKNQVVQFEVITLNKNEIKDQKWNLVWEDNFDGAKIDESKWNFVDGGHGFGNNEHQYYTNREKNARVEDGKLVIEAHKENYKGNPYTSAKLTTEGKGDWTYGRYEIRAKMPIGKGMWPAIWMMPSDYNLYSGWPACGEIDIMEYLGHDPGTVYGTLHYGMPWKHTGEKYTLPNQESFADDFHTFTLDWEPGEMRWYVDGILFAKQNDWYSKREGEAAEYTYPAPFDRDFYLQLNLAVGGNWPGYPDETTVFPQQFVIDYVKVYELDGVYREAGERPQAEEQSNLEGARPPLEDGNYVYNGQFDEELNYWSFQPFEPKDLFGGEGEVSFDQGALKTTITKEGNAPWAIQLVQTELPLVKGERYQLSFDAWSTGRRNMITNISGPDRGYSRYLVDQTIALTSERQRFQFEFDMELDSDINSRVEFNMGQSSSLPVWIDNVRLIKLPKDPNAPKPVLSSGNYIYNGTFDQGPNRLGFWNFSTKSPAKAKATVGSAIAERELKVTVTNPGKSSDAIKLVQDKLNLSKDKKYILSFDARADQQRPLEVRVTNELGNVVHASKNITLTKEMKNHLVLLELEGELDGKSELQFLFGNSRVTTFMDNIVLKEIKEPKALSSGALLEAEDYQDMFGVQKGEDGQSVGWIDEGDWMQYAVHVQEAGEYTVRYLVASGVDGGQITLLSKAGNISTGDLGFGEIPLAEADSVSSIEVPQTGSWETWKVVTSKIYLEKGVQTLQIFAPRVNLDWLHFSLAGNESEGQLIKNGTFEEQTNHWDSWWGDQWSGIGEGSLSTENGELKVEISKTGDQSYSPQFFQEGLFFEEGQTYVVSFDARTSQNRKIIVNIGKALQADPWFIQYVDSQTFDLTTEMKTYRFQFTMNQPTYHNGKIVFELGRIAGESIPADLHFDNVNIMKVKE